MKMLSPSPVLDVMKLLQDARGAGCLLILIDVAAALKGREVILMFNVVATLRVLPESPEVDLEGLEKSIRAVVPSHMELHTIEREPIAFGLVALNVMVLTTDDEKGDVTPLEESIQNLEAVSQVEVTDVRRTLG